LAHPYVLPYVLFPWLHLYEGLSFGVGVAVVEVVAVVVEGVAPETVVAGVEAVGTVVVVGVEAAGTVVVEELVLETVALVEGVAPETVVAEVEAALGTVVVGVEAALGTVVVVEGVAPETVAVDPLEIVEEGVNFVDIVVD